MKKKCYNIQIIIEKKSESKKINANQKIVEQVKVERINVKKKKRNSPTEHGVN